MTDQLSLQFIQIPRLRHRAVWAVVGLVLFVLVINVSLYLQPVHADVLPSPHEQYLVLATNHERALRGLSELRYSPILAEAARAKASDMLANGYFDHVSPSGKTPWSFVVSAGYDYLRAGENLAIDFPDVKGPVPAWMASPAHRANILKDNYKDVAIAEVSGTFKGRPTTIVVQMFGTKSW